jgi:hypothetical protein
MFDWLQSIVSTLVVCILLFVFAGRTIGVYGSSMRQTLEEGDRLVISNLFYTPKYGDIVVLRKESFADYPIVKRVIATEGRPSTSISRPGRLRGRRPARRAVHEHAHQRAGGLYRPGHRAGGLRLRDGRQPQPLHDSRTNTIGCVDTRYIIGKALLRITPISASEGSTEMKEPAGNISPIQWFPGHMAKAERMIAENMKLVDAVAELLDARIPLSSGTRTSTASRGTAADGDLNRADSRNPAVTARWRRWFREQGLTVLETDARSGKGVKDFVPAVRGVLREKLAALEAKGQGNRPLRG